MATTCKSPPLRRAQKSRLSFETPDTVRKRGQTFRLRREVEAMEFVRSHTSIPVPKVLDTHFDTDDEDRENSWFLMERLPGDQLGEVWPAMSEASREETIRQLKSYFQQLHGIRPTGGEWIGSCSKGPAYDHRLTNMATCGPFMSVGAFHDFLVAPVKSCPRPEWVTKYRIQLRDDYSITFAHADVSWENILVDQATGKVTGILDWEMAGFWPEWWEYRKALYGGRSQPWWNEGIVKKIMQEYLEETLIDMDLEMF